MEQTTTIFAGDSGSAVSTTHAILHIGLFCWKGNHFATTVIPKSIQILHQRINPFTLQYLLGWLIWFYWISARDYPHTTRLFLFWLIMAELSLPDILLTENQSPSYSILQKEFTFDPQISMHARKKTPKTNYKRKPFKDLLEDQGKKPDSDYQPTAIALKCESMSLSLAFHNCGPRVILDG